MADQNALTFTEFQATGRKVDDLRQIRPDMDDIADPVPARIYTDANLYLEPARDNTNGEYIAEVGNSGVQGSLEECEAYLYGYYLHEVAGDDVRDEMMRMAPEVTRKHWSL